MNERERRWYPTVCTSAYCGSGPDACPGCRHYPALRGFKDWVERTKARPVDPTWAPGLYEATVEATVG